MKLEKGAKVKVRLHTGEVVEAVYDEPYHEDEKRHWVDTSEYGFMIAGRCPPNESIRVRFVGNPCDLVPVGVSV